MPAFDALQDMFEDFYVKPKLQEARQKRFEEKDAVAKARIAERIGALSFGRAADYPRGAH